jgi:hypothetical protein
MLKNFQRDLKMQLLGSQLIISGHQPNYLPWLGFFDKMRTSNIFIIEDNVQFEKQGFTNRNRIKTVDGVRWLSVPIKHADKPLLINEVEISNSAEPNWAQRHWLTLKHNYCKAPFWDTYSGFFKETYEQKWIKLIDLNMHLIRGIMQILNIHTELIMSSSLGATGKKSELVLAQCKALGGNIQLAGKGGHNYINTKRFDEEGIKIVFQDYQHPSYTQLHGEFAPNLSVVDYLFCCGSGGWQKEKQEKN